MTIVHVDDMILATNNSHQAESHISRLLSKYDIKNVKRADDDGDVLYCRKRVWTVLDDMKPRGLSLRQDQTESVKARCEPASMLRARARQEGPQCSTSEIREMRCMTGSLRWLTGGTRPDESFATSQLQRKQSAPLVSDHKRAVQTIKRLRCQPEIGLKFGPLPTKMCVLVYTDSALHNADVDTDEEDQTAGGWQRRSRRVSVSVLSMVCWYVWWLRTIWGKQKPFQYLSCPGRAKLQNEPSCLLLGPRLVHVEMLLTWQNTREQCCASFRLEKDFCLTNGRRSTRLSE